MSKVFGYPRFDPSGEMVLTTYTGDYAAMLMDVRVYRMKAGETRTFRRVGEEIAVLLLSGKAVFTWETQRAETSRRNVFTEGPWCVHASSGVEIAVAAERETELLVQRTRNEKSFPSRLYRPEDAPWKYSCVGKFGGVAQRRVNTIFDHDICPDSNMVLGEVLATGPAICPIGIPSRRPTFSYSTDLRALEPVLWETRFLKAWTTAFPPFPAGPCTPRLWPRAFRCTPPG